MSSKNKRKAPAFQLYADDFLAGTADMTAEEVGGFIRLLCHQWAKGGLPDSEERTGMMAGLMGSPSLRYVLSKFDKDPSDGLLKNKRLESVRSEKDAYLRGQSESGLKGALARWNSCRAHGDPNGERVANGVATPMANGSRNDGSPSPSPSPIKEEEAFEAKLEKQAREQEAYTVLEVLNEVSGRKYRATDGNLSIIKARLSEPGVDVAEAIKMVRRQAKIWMPDPKMSEYVRPETLFGKSKFDGYFANRDLPIQKPHPQPQLAFQPEKPKRPPGEEWKDAL